MRARRVRSPNRGSARSGHATHWQRNVTSHFGLERLRAGPPVKTLTDMLKRIDGWVRMSKTPIERCDMPGRAGTDQAERNASRAGGQDANPPATPAVRSAHSGSSYPARVTAALGSAAAATIRACVLNP